MYKMKYSNYDKILVPKEFYIYFRGESLILVTEKYENPSPKQKEEYHKLFVHILNHNWFSRGKDEIEKNIRYNKFCPISRDFIRGNFHSRLSLYSQYGLEIFDTTNYNIEKALSREYRFKRKVISQLNYFLIENYTNLVRLTDGKKVGSIKIKTNITTFIEKDGIKHNQPLFLVNAIKALSPAPLNTAYTQKYLKHVNTLAGNVAEDSVLGRKYDKILASIMKFGIAIMPYTESIVNSNTRLFHASYEISTTGRIYGLLGGFQGCPRYIKHILLKDIECYNYDMANAHISILLLEFEYCNLDTKWIRTYLKRGKEYYAKELGVSTSIWKKCVYALAMGGSLRKYVTVKNRLQKGAVYGILYNNNPSSAGRLLLKFKKMTKDFITVRDRWYKIILYTYNKRYHYKSNGKTHWKNACGKHFKRINYDKIASSDLKAQWKRKIPAFIVQGMEACFIHHITIICDANNIKVFHNEHDGIITDKKIPQKLVDIAIEKSGLTTAVLRLKPICTDKDIKKYKIGRHKGYKNG